MKALKKMKRHGLKSCGDKSRYINIRYFYIKDIIDREGISVERYRTEDMIADLFKQNYFKDQSSKE